MTELSAMDIASDLFGFRPVAGSRFHIRSDIDIAASSTHSTPTPTPSRPQRQQQQQQYHPASVARLTQPDADEARPTQPRIGFQVPTSTAPNLWSPTAEVEESRTWHAMEHQEDRMALLQIFEARENRARTVSWSQDDMAPGAFNMPERQHHHSSDPQIQRRPTSMMVSEARYPTSATSTTHHTFSPSPLQLHSDESHTWHAGSLEHVEERAALQYHIEERDATRQRSNSLQGVGRQWPSPSRRDSLSNDIAADLFGNRSSQPTNRVNSINTIPDPTIDPDGNIRMVEPAQIRTGVPANAQQRLEALFNRPDR